MMRKTSIQISFCSLSCVGAIVHLHPCHEIPDLRCVDTKISMGQFLHDGEMILSTALSESAIICSNSPGASISGTKQRIEFGLGDVVFGTVKTDANSCIDNRHPVLGLSQTSSVTSERDYSYDHIVITPNKLIIDVRFRERLLCNPNRPGIAYTESPSNGRVWSVQAAVSFNEDRPKRYSAIPYVIDTSSEVSSISREDLVEFIQRIQESSGVIFALMQDGQYKLPNCHEIIHLLPTVTLRTSDDVRLVVQPKDYMDRDCALLFHATEPGRSHIIGDNVLRLYTVHFDLLHNRIGFCEQL